ncbi:farnesyl pyrophosphate synthase-like [Stomoxys calcitrans]|uniref:farnesyl pyrophosphate synthase-like n=1 Tax=Stomoxys calcitrans TaxID=35570 RepID=UPI0027E2B0BD|nr:farnesyl pyrophosphate synthase-like [Stomoxys calcitrans]
MERANEQQKLIMMEGYGSKDPLKVQRVKDLYKALDLPSVFAAYEEKSYNDITDHIKQISSDVPPEIFLHILNKIYRR